MKKRESQTAEAIIQPLLEKPMSALVKSCLKQMESWHRKRARTIHLFDLSRALKLSLYMTHSKVELYDDRQDPMGLQEYLGYIKVAIFRLDYVLPQELHELFQVIPLTEKQQQILTELDVKRWQHTFELIENQYGIAKTSPVLRLKISPSNAVIESAVPGEAFRRLSATKLRELCRQSIWRTLPKADRGSEVILRSTLEGHNAAHSTEFSITNENLPLTLSHLMLDRSLFSQHVVDEQGEPILLHDVPLKWKLQPSTVSPSHMLLSLQGADGEMVTEVFLTVSGLRHYVWLSDGFHPVTKWPVGAKLAKFPLQIPIKALISSAGYSLLKQLEVAIPEEISRHVTTITPQVFVKCSLIKGHGSTSDRLVMTATASSAQGIETHKWNTSRWEKQQKGINAAGQMIEIDESPLQRSASWLGSLNFKISPYYNDLRHELRATKTFPDQFIEWIKAKPDSIEVALDATLSEMVNSIVSGNVFLEVVESEHGIDWFDIRVDVTVSDTSLTPNEIELLLKAKGKWVRLSNKGWRKLEYNLSPETERELADIGLSAQDFDAGKQRLHALQLGSLAKKQSQLLPVQAQQQITRRIEQIQTRVTPALPTSIKATLRPYQTEGFHFLAYLSANHFGGVLADDMGLGKTIQALTWLAWLHETGKNSLPTLVVAPKSVQENWSQEAARFFPQLRTRTWKTGEIEEIIDPTSFDLLIINYAQLRNRSDALQAVAWLAIIVDEAQNIKNPNSQSTQVLRALHANQRLALTGTPIENRLMDLWSIFSFAMPGALGSRASFSRTFDNPKDLFARRRLSARTRPFLLRRTKNEVAKDLPERIEEDLTIELEGIQKKLYQAELKRARAHLLKARIPGQLDKLRFHLLSSLLRLRQICCHPQLVGLDARSEPENTSKKKPKKQYAQTAASDSGTSAKLEALMELLEPLIEQGQKVLVFSQFVHMLEIIRAEIAEREWKQFLLTGQTDERGALVQDFQTTEDAAVFLISLKAGGAGLNLTAASYVVLFDPWWNPAVEAQAIDRTHRIGQKSTVIAYRLVVKDTIEQKIRELQKFKSAVAQDILGEENFARALTLDDFQFLLESE